MSLLWRQCVCGAWYWGSEQTAEDKAHSRLAASATDEGLRPGEYVGGHYVARPAVPALDVVALRSGIQSSYLEHPDDSHGQGYINHGIRIALAAVNKLAGDVDPYARCSPRQKAFGLEWCSVHHGPYEQSAWACSFAAAPWTWRDTASEEPT